MNTMTSDQIRRNIAEACGWENVHVQVSRDGSETPFGNRKDRFLKVIPNYPESHDAMAEALGTLKQDDQPFYILYLQDLVKTSLSWEVHTATPIQKAEAFLRAKGLWEEVE